MKVAYLTIRVELDDTVDMEDFQQELDYTITYDGVVNTELTLVDVITVK